MIAQHCPLPCLHSLAVPSCLEEGKGMSLAASEKVFGGDPTPCGQERRSWWKMGQMLHCPQKSGRSGARCWRAQGWMLGGSGPRRSRPPAPGEIPDLDDASPPPQSTILAVFPEAYTPCRAPEDASLPSRHQLSFSSINAASTHPFLPGQTGHHHQPRPRPNQATAQPRNPRIPAQLGAAKLRGAAPCTKSNKPHRKNPHQQLPLQ